MRDFGSTKVLVHMFIVCGCMCTGSAQGPTGADAKALRQKLFVTDGYDSKIRPQINQSDPIEVYVNFYLLSINALDEVTETLKTTGYLWILWHDDFLTWDPASFGGIEYYHWPQGDVWKPDIALKNSYLEYKELGVSSLNVFVYNTGNIEWTPFQVFQSTCAVDITYFPFDIQVCKLKFVAWSYTKAEVVIMSGHKGIEMHQYENNSEWDVLGTSYAIEWDSYEASIVFTLKIKRKPLYVLLSVLLPIIMLAILNISVFLLPCDSGEKASYAVTVFLAFAVFLSIISSTLPENSDNVAYFSVYLIILTLESTMISLIALVLIRISSFDKNETPVPGKLQSFLNVVTCRKCCSSNKVSGLPSPEYGEMNANVKLSAEKRGEIKSNEIVPANTKVKEDVTSNEDPKPVYTWNDVANIMDRVFFIFFALALLVATFVFFIVTSANSGDNTEQLPAK